MAKNDNWATPPDLMKVLDAEFNFNLEVCAAVDNRALETLYMGLDNGYDALLKPWVRDPTSIPITYCNPPYSQLPAFVHMAASQDWGTHVLLIPAYTDTAIWHDIIFPFAHEARALRGRLRFWENGHVGKDTARFSSAVVVFTQTKGLKGCTLRPWDWKPAKSEPLGIPDDLV